MAELLGVGIGTINKFERGEYPERLGVDIIFNIWKHFRITPTALLDNHLDGEDQ